MSDQGQSSRNSLVKRLKFVAGIQAAPDDRDDILEAIKILSAPLSERGRNKADKRDAARWRILEHGCQWVSFTETNGETHSFDPRQVTGYQGDLQSMRNFADEISERQLKILLKDGLEKLKRQFERPDSTKEKK